MIGIIGSGTMGKGIATEFARFGNKVVLLSAQRHLKAKDLEFEVDNVSKRYDDINIADIHSNIILTRDFEDLKECDFIIEAVAEDLETKRNSLKNAILFLKKETIFASNTSSLSIKDIFSDLVNLENVCGLHFFNPVHIMKLVELSYLDETSDKTLTKAKELALSIEKEVIMVKNSTGFIVNRLLIPMINEAAKIVEEGIASIEDIDKAMKFGANHPIGPLKLSDLIGNDITLMILNSLKDKLDIKISSKMEEIVKENKLGRKTKEGFYLYRK